MILHVYSSRSITPRHCVRKTTKTEHTCGVSGVKCTPHTAHGVNRVPKWSNTFVALKGNGCPNFVAFVVNKSYIELSGFKTLGS